MRTPEVTRAATRVIRKAAHQSVFALLVSNSKTQLQVIVDLSQKSLNLSVTDEDERLGVVVKVPDVVSVVEVSVGKDCVRK